MKAPFSAGSQTPQSGDNEPSSECSLCSRLAQFRAENRVTFPGWFNAPVPSFGGSDARLLVVGLAPGLKGANRTGRPFTGDYAGVLLYETLLKYGFASGPYGERIDDGLRLVDCRITNAARCVPPQNKPLPAEVRTCSQFLNATLKDMPRLTAILALGRIAFDAVIRAYGLKISQFPFGHGRTFDVAPRVKLFGSYHCSRYNTNTGTLTEAMFHQVFEDISAYIQLQRSK